MLMNHAKVSVLFQVVECNVAALDAQRVLRSTLCPTSRLNWAGSSAAAWLMTARVARGKSRCI